MAHTYTPLTKSDNTYTPVSDITPLIGDVEEKFTWVNIVPNHDTWLELTISGKVHWCDWLYATGYVDAWTSITTPAKTYSSITKSDRTYIPVTTPSQTYSEVTK